MQEITLKNNDLGLKVFINGIPNLSLIPTEKLDSTISVLEVKITEYYKKANAVKGIDSVKQD